MFVERWVSYFQCKQIMMSFRGQACSAKMMSLVGRLTTLACHPTIAIESLQNRLLKVCYVPATNPSLSRLLFLFLQWPLTVLTNEANKAGSKHL
jgi:hypothetical protein